MKIDVSSSRNDPELLRLNGSAEQCPGFLKGGSTIVLTRNQQDRRFHQVDLVDGAQLARTDAETRLQLEREKRRERPEQGIFHDLPPGLPALAYAAKTRKRAAAAGFRFAGADAALAKLREEIDELAVDPGAGELGDVMFAAVCLAAEVGVDAELALHATATRFRRRIESAVVLADEAGENFEELGAVEQYAWYRAAKGAGTSG